MGGGGIIILLYTCKSKYMEGIPKSATVCIVYVPQSLNI